MATTLHEGAGFVRFWIPGTPGFKRRHRTGRRGSYLRGRPVHYSDPRTKAFEEAVKLAARGAQRGGAPWEGPVSLEITAGFVPPKSWANWKRVAALAGEICATTKPDQDNIAKAVLDACNEVLWVDDAQVTVCSVRKIYTDQPGVLVEAVALPRRQAAQHAERAS